MNIQSNMTLTPRENPFTPMNIREEYSAITGARTFLENVWFRIKNALSNYNTRYELSRLGDRELKDIGMTREQARNYRKSVEL
jgi:uncharacterized protein YjiS (DUF1127 family)